MNDIASKSAVLVMFGLSALGAMAQSPLPEADPALRLIEPTPPQRNRFGLSYRSGFNTTVNFKNIGTMAAPASIGSPTGGGQNRTYDDGYNRVDVTGNNHGPGFDHTTWNWGYNNASQVQPSAANPQTIAFHSASASGAVSQDNGEDLQPGFEITYNRELIQKFGCTWGLETAFGYSQFEVDDNDPLSLPGKQITDTYTVPSDSSGMPLPPAGHQGNFQGPGAVIGDIPTRTTSSINGTVTGTRKFTADLYGFRFGPYVQIPLGSKVNFNLSAGFALVYVKSDFRYYESASIAGLSSPALTSSSSHEDWLPGGYVSGTFSYKLSDRWGVFTGAQFQDVGKYTQTQAGRQAVLDLRESVFVTLGATFSF
jgi:hypothetical protein